jgi:tRNA (cmo5U34)-methyltransferase
MTRQDTVWQQPELVRTFVNEVRGGVPYAADQLAVMGRVIAASGRPLGAIADLGCGSGVTARAVLAQHPAAQAVLVDFSEPMLAAARQALADHRPTPIFAAADLADRRWTAAVCAQAPFDVIASSYAIHHLTDARKRALYGEIFGLLAPGGVFVNVEHVASASPRVEALSDALIIDSIHAFQAAKGADLSREQVARDFVRRPDKAANILAPVEAQCDWLRAIGFVDVDCFFKVFELAVFGGWKPEGFKGSRVQGSKTS